MTQSATSDAQSQRLSGGLGVPSIVFMVVAAAAPLTVIAGVVPIGFAYGDGAGFPAMFALVGIALLLFAVGFNVMTRHVPKPGAFFTYIAHGLGRPAGLAAAYSAVLCYMAIELGVFGFIGYEIDDGIQRLGGPHIHWSIYAFLSVAAVGWLGFRHIELSSKLLAVLLTLEIAIVMLISIVVVLKGGADGLDLTSFKPSTINSGAPSLGIMFAIASFIGFEATAIFRDESREPSRTIPRATFAAVIIVGLFYTFTSWALVMAWGSSNVVKQAATDPAFLFTTAKAQLGGFGEASVHVLLISSIFAACLAFHNITTRYLHALSSAGVLPAYLSQVNPRQDRAPSNASLTVSVTSAVLVAICLAFGLDPYLKIFTWFVGLGSLIYILLLAACSLAVIAYFRSRPGESPWQVVVAPLLGLAGLVVSAFITIKHFPLLVGDLDAQGNERFGGLSIFLLAAVVAVIAIGMMQAVMLRSRGSRSYDQIVEVAIT